MYRPPINISGVWEESDSWGGGGPDNIVKDVLGAPLEDEEGSFGGAGGSTFVVVGGGGGNLMTGSRTQLGYIINASSASWRRMLSAVTKKP